MRLLVCGDFVPRFRVAEQIETGNYSFFDEVKSYTKESDYSIVNFESPIVNGEATPIIKTGPNLKCHKNAMEAVRYAGFNCVTLANNHFYDYGDKGVVDTIKACSSNGIDYVGGGKDLKEAERVLYKEINGERLAVINVCEHEWSIATCSSGGSAPLDIVRNTRVIHEAKKNANYVIMIIHGGTEHYQLPTPRMKETYRFFVEEGVDAIVNHHQHCYSGYEVYQGKPIFYGIGNFCFDKNDPSDALWNSGYAVQIEMGGHLISSTLLPYKQCFEDPIVHFFSSSISFNEKILLLNKMIEDDVTMKESFKQMAIKKDSFLSFLEPYNNNYLKALKERGLLPSFVSREKKDIILELFKCEAHRDVMFELLKS